MRVNTIVEEQQGARNVPFRPLREEVSFWLKGVLSLALFILAFGIL